MNNNVCLNIFIGLLHKYKPFYCFLTLGSWPGIVTRTMKLCSFLFLPPTPYGLTALVGRSPIIVEVLRLLRHATLCRTPPLDERSASLRDLYLQIPSPHKRDIHASIGIRTRYPACERPQTYALARTANEIGLAYLQWKINSIMNSYKIT